MTDRYRTLRLIAGWADKKDPCMNLTFVVREDLVAELDAAMHKASLDEAFRHLAVLVNGAVMAVEEDGEVKLKQ